MSPGNNPIAVNNNNNNNNNNIVVIMGHSNTTGSMGRGLPCPKSKCYSLNQTNKAHSSTTH